MPDKADPDCWARLRFAIIGPLLAAPPPRGQLRGELARAWRFYFLRESIASVKA